MVEQRADLTFKYNLKKGRHGWLRLTPAYSIKIVQQILDENPDMTYVLDPFSGTGTTGLVCAERAVRCDLLDINPFLVWFARAKTASYQLADLQLARESSALLCRYAEKLPSRNGFWIPPIHNIQRWWPENRLDVLARVFVALNQQLPAPAPVKDLLLIAFCNLIISWSNAAFNHQSLSFKENDGQQLSLFDEEQQIYAHFVEWVDDLTRAAEEPLSGKVTVRQADSRCIPQPQQGEYDGVITSPPYPNRMSYIRELRPYMYWLGYLKDGREAGELDWQAIGGTWGIATSRLETWESQDTPFLDSEFQTMIASIAQKGPALAKYVQRYFVDIASHLQSLCPVLQCGAKVFYIVGNSRFYDTLVPVEQIYAKLLEANGFVNTSITAIRKRNSKKELFEYIVAAQRGSHDTP
ncbi:MAG: SAM-dependent methyltransferase [Anaerolineae bacterium]|nr:SAM-dependent methyltransferase [Anaerolineae bacterium]